MDRIALFLLSSLSRKEEEHRAWYLYFVGRGGGADDDMKDVLENSKPSIAGCQAVIIRNKTMEGNEVRNIQDTKSQYTMTECKYIR